MEGDGKMRELEELEYLLSKARRQRKILEQTMGWIKGLAKKLDVSVDLEKLEIKEGYK